MPKSICFVIQLWSQTFKSLSQFLFQCYSYSRWMSFSEAIVILFSIDFQHFSHCFPNVSYFSDWFEYCEAFGDYLQMNRCIDDKCLQVIHSLLRAIRLSDVRQSHSSIEKIVFTIRLHLIEKVIISFSFSFIPLFCSSFASSTSSATTSSSLSLGTHPHRPRHRPTVSATVLKAGTHEIPFKFQLPERYLLFRFFYSFLFLLN